MKYAVLRPEWIAGNRNSETIAAAAVIGLTRYADELGDVRVTDRVDVALAADRIVVWGLGHPRGQQLLAEAAADGKTVIGFDLGYWRRDGDDPRYRVSINDEHPQLYVMQEDLPLGRLLEDGITLRADHDPDGPVILVGIGHKSAATYGEAPGVWEQQAVESIRRIWPDRRLIFRPKRNGGDHKPEGVDAIVADGPIEALLRGAACAVCRHSNVAVDAIIAGVPATAEDGAASAVLPSLAVTVEPPRPLSERDQLAFLANLAWFQWSASELKGPESWSAIDSIIRSVNP